MYVIPEFNENAWVLCSVDLNEGGPRSHCNVLFLKDGFRKSKECLDSFWSILLWRCTTHPDRKQAASISLNAQWVIYPGPCIDFPLDNHTLDICTDIIHM